MAHGPGQVERFLEGWLAAHDTELIDTAARLIRIESVTGPAGPGQPFGPGVGAAMALVEATAGRLGLVTRNVDGYAVHAEYGAGPETVGALVHVDVVPAGQGWSVPPFGGEVRDGRLFGRGAVDDKGPVAAVLFAAGALVASGAPVHRRIRVIVGGDEESGFRCLRYYFQHERRPELAFAPDAVFPVVFAEKGALGFVLRRATVSGQGIIRARGGSRPNVVPDRCEVDVQLPADADPAAWVRRLEAAARDVTARIRYTVEEGRRLRVVGEGVSAHASTPEKGVSAIADLMACLAAADAGQRVLDPNGVATFLGNARDVYGGFLGIRRRDDISGPLTVNLGVLEWHDGQVVATFNVRYPVSLGDARQLVAAVRATAEPLGFTVESVSDDPPHYVNPEGTLVRALREVYREETGDDTPPLAIGGGTYARALPGAVAFGPVFPFEDMLAHEPDESIALDDLRRIARIYARALWALARA